MGRMYIGEVAHGSRLHIAVKQNVEPVARAQHAGSTGRNMAGALLVGAST